MDQVHPVLGSQLPEDNRQKIEVFALEYIFTRKLMNELRPIFPIFRQMKARIHIELAPAPGYIK